MFLVARDHKGGAKAPLIREAILSWNLGIFNLFPHANFYRQTVSNTSPQIQGGDFRPWPERLETQSLGPFNSIFLFGKPQKRFDAMDILVIGGGISGLSLAWGLHRRGLEVGIAESSNRWGGLIATQREDGFLVEQGPNSTMQKPGRPEDALGRLVESLNLSASLIEAGAAGKRRYVMRDGRLLPLPGSPPAFVTTSLFSLKDKLRLLAEPFIRRGDAEETIAAFVRRRLGNAFLNYAVQPFISGVYAGDAERLSVRAATPRIHALETKYGSLIRGAIALGKIARNAGMPAGRLISFEDGMERLPRALAEALPAERRWLGRTVTAILPDAQEGWRVRWRATSSVIGAPAEGEIVARRIVLSVPADAAANLVEPLSAETAARLRSIFYAPIVSAAFAWPKNAIGHTLDGFGFLIPRVEKRRLLGGLFSTALFPGRAPIDHSLVTAFIGGSMDLDAVKLSDSNLIDVMTQDLNEALTITARPDRVWLTRYAQAIPQYTLGHLEKTETISELSQAHFGLSFRASWSGGVSVADCIRNSELLCEKLTH
ncbi:Coproporphyrinogen III oxidase [Azospirillaceae bacterium]